MVIYRICGYIVLLYAVSNISSMDIFQKLFIIGLIIIFESFMWTIIDELRKLNK